MEPLTDEQIDWVQSQAERWARIRERESDEGPITPADVGHAALLRRLLSGEEPFYEPPPRMYSYPAYRWAEGERGKVWDVSARRGPSPLQEERIPLDEAEPGDHVLIAQAIWDVESRDGNVVTVRWKDSGWVGRLFPTDDAVGDYPVWSFVKVSGG